MRKYNIAVGYNSTLLYRLRHIGFPCVFAEEMSKSLREYKELGYIRSESKTPRDSEYRISKGFKSYNNKLGKSL